MINKSSASSPRRSSPGISDAASQRCAPAETSSSTTSGKRSSRIRRKPARTYGPTAPAAYPDTPKTTTSHPHRPEPAKHPAHKRRPRGPHGRASAPSPTHRCPRPQSRTVPSGPRPRRATTIHPHSGPLSSLTPEGICRSAHPMARGAGDPHREAATSPRYNCKIPPSQNRFSPLCGNSPSRSSPPCCTASRRSTCRRLGLVRAAVAATGTATCRRSRLTRTACGRPTRRTCRAPAHGSRRPEPAAPGAPGPATGPSWCRGMTARSATRCPGSRRR